MKTTFKWLVSIPMTFVLLLFTQLAIAQESEVKVDSEEEVQETMYVTDKLRLSLYKKADSRSSVLKLLVSGDQLDVLKISGPYSKVKTKAGTVGWVKNGFLVQVPTDSFLLLEEQKKNEILTSQLSKLSNTQEIVADYENTISKMTDDYKSIERDLIKEQEALKQSIEEIRTLSEQNIAYESGKEGNQTLQVDLWLLAKLYWKYIVTILVVILIAGFILGKKVVEARVKQRFQGVKVW